VLRYNHTSKDMLHRFKFEDKTQYAKRFAKLIHTSYSAIIKEAQLIIAVPQHKKRLKQRRYNHAALIAYEIAKIADKQFSPNALQKLRYTSLQANLGYAQRQQNLQNAFLANSNVQDKVILLVDDIMTTGATASECALALKKAGALKVFVTTIARTY
jgi:ComF family protein